MQLDAGTEYQGPSTHLRSPARTDATASYRPAVDPAWPSIPGYTIERAIAVGGMGAVYLAQQHFPEHKVVIMFIKSEFADSGELRIRFIREANVMCTLRHPNIVLAFDAADANGPLRLIMEYLDGQNL